MSRAPLWQRLWQDERGVIGTAAAIALALGAGASAGASAYGTRSAAGQNRRATEATERSDVRAGEREEAALAETRREHEADLARQIAEDARVEQSRQDVLARQRVEDARAEQARQDRLAFAREQWQGYLGAQQPHWRLGADVLGRLSDMAGGDFSAGDGEMRQYLAALPTSGGPSSGAGGGVPGPGLRSSVRPLPGAPLASPVRRYADTSRGAIPQAGASRSALPSISDLMMFAARYGGGQSVRQPLPTRGTTGGLSMADYMRAQALPAL